MRGLIIVIIVAVAAYFGYRYFATTDSGQQVAEQVGEAAKEATEKVEAATQAVTEATKDAASTASDTAQQAAQSVSDLTVNGVDLGQQIGTAISDATSALQGITDKASAEAALPSLEAVEAKLDELGSNVENLSDSGQEALASLLSDGMPTLRELVAKVEGIDGVGPVVKPTLDAIMAKLDDWAKPPA